MSKTFMTATGANRQLQIKRSDDAVMIRHYDPEFSTQQVKTFFLNPSDAPALALAVLEAAIPDGQKVVSAMMADALQALRDEVRRIEDRESAARDLAELEAEALELFNVGAIAGSASQAPHESFGHIPDYAQPKWLAVARKAREMRAEK